MTFTPVVMMMRADVATAVGWEYHRLALPVPMSQRSDAPAQPLETTMNLLAKARNGDGQAVELLFERCLPALRRWARGRLPSYARDLADTQDLVQETVLHTLNKLESFEPRHQGALQAYLRQAVANRIRDEIRRVTRRPVPEELGDDRVDPAALDEHERRLLKQLRLVAGLADVHRSQVDDPAPPVANLPWVSTSGERWGHLLLIEKIGEGSYGEVYRARDTWLDREVALKLLKPMPGQEAALLRILHEARTLARVRHPNVVTVHGADIHDGRVGLWMEFVPGRTLEDALQTRERFTVAEAVLIGQELCQALAAVHASGLVHRDVKTRNVIREGGGRVVLMDFGA